MARIDDLVAQIENTELRNRVAAEVEKLNKQKKFGLVFEEHMPECTPLYEVPPYRDCKAVRFGDKGKLNTDIIYRVLKINGENALCVVSESKEEPVEIPVRELVTIAEFGDPIYPQLMQVDSVCNAPDSDLWHTLIQADNYHALQLLKYLYAGKVDCIYIDPPYNTGAKDWKYNNDYVDSNDQYRHSKWLSFMEKRLKLAKKLLNPADSVLIVTIDEKEYLHLGCLLEEIFSDARIQMISTCINPAGSSRDNQFMRSDEYIFFVGIGNASPIPLELNEEWLVGIKNSTKGGVHWNSLMRTGTSARRSDRPNMFFPIYVEQRTKRIVKVGDALPLEIDRFSVEQVENTIAVFPIRTDGSEGRWRVSANTLRKLYENHFVKVGRFTENGAAISYLAEGEQTKIREGVYEIVGIADDNSYIINDESYKPRFIPMTQWLISSHDASRNGTNLLTKIIGEKRFAFPKSLYAVHDTINFFVANKPNALIVDFFAGSGTTLHAVNLLNAEDGGHRRCILVTNNEVSAEEATTLSAQGYKPGDTEWEKLGIAQYVTWPRTICSIEGHDMNGNPLDGNYISSATKTTEKSRSFTKIDFAIEFEQMKAKDKKALLKFCVGGTLPQKLVAEDTRFVISEEPDHTASVLFDDTALEEWLEALDDMTHITDFYIVTKKEKLYKQAKSEIQEILGNIEITEPLLVPMADGFKANAIFFKLGFLDKNAVALGKQFKELLPILWMKAGAIGKMPIIDSENIPNMLILPENHFAVLTNEIFYEEFAEQVNAMPEIETVYIITDYEPGYRNMISGLNAKYTYQLYRDYLDNFRINTGRN